jgi:hypothetical protein
MSRTVASNVQDEIVKQSVQAFHICKLEFSSADGGDGPSYLSEGPEVSFGGQNYLTNSLNVGAMSWAQSGVQKAQITLVDDGLGSAIGLALRNQLADVPATLWLVYRDETGADTTPVMLVAGTLNPISITDSEVKMDILAVRVDAEFYPDQYCTKDNGFNYLPREGQVVDWGEEKFELVTNNG